MPNTITNTWTKIPPMAIANAAHGVTGLSK